MVEPSKLRRLGSAALLVSKIPRPALKGSMITLPLALVRTPKIMLSAVKLISPPPEFTVPGTRVTVPVLA